MKRFASWTIAVLALAATVAEAQPPPVVSNMFVDYDPNTPDRVWVTVAANNLDPADDQSTLNVYIVSGEETTDGILQDEFDYHIDPDRMFRFGI